MVTLIKSGFLNCSSHV